MKRVAPIIIILIVCAGVLLWTVAGFVTGWLGFENLGVGLLIMIPGLCIIAALIATLVSRIKEIDKEEEEDLTKY